MRKKIAVIITENKIDRMVRAEFASLIDKAMGIAAKNLAELVATDLNAEKCIALMKLLAMTETHLRKKTTANASSSNKIGGGFLEDAAVFFYRLNRRKWKSRRAAAIDLTNEVNGWSKTIFPVGDQTLTYSAEDGSHNRQLLKWLEKADKADSHTWPKQKPAA